MIEVTSRVTKATQIVKTLLHNKFQNVQWDFGLLPKHMKDYFIVY